MFSDQEQCKCVMSSELQFVFFTFQTTFSDREHSKCVILLSELNSMAFGPEGINQNCSLYERNPNFDSFERNYTPARTF